LIAGLGAFIVPVYFFKCFNVLVIEPECHKESGKEKVFIDTNESKEPEWSHDVIFEIWEAFHEQQKSRRWSD